MEDALGLWANARGPFALGMQTSSSGPDLLSSRLVAPCALGRQ